MLPARVRIEKRIAKALRRLARGEDVRREAGGEVSERAILERLERQLTAMNAPRGAGG